jgi:hypothetical protein
MASLADVANRVDVFLKGTTRRAIRATFLTIGRELWELRPEEIG